MHRNDDGTFKQRDGLSVYRPKAGSTQAETRGEFADLYRDVGSGTDERVASTGNAVGDNLGRRPAGFVGDNPDYARDDFGADEQNKAKTAGQVEPAPRRSDWVGPRPLGESAYIRGEQERKDTVGN